MKNLKNEPGVYPGGFDIEAKRNRLKELEFELAEPALWKNREMADAKIKEIGELNELIKKFDEIENLIRECSACLSDRTGRSSAPASRSDLHSCSADLDQSRRSSSAELQELPYETSTEQKKADTFRAECLGDSERLVSERSEEARCRGSSGGEPLERADRGSVRKISALLPSKIQLLQSKLRQLEIEQLFTGKYDKQSAILSIYAGAGGQDAEDWAGMLFEMYAKFAEKRGWKTKIIDESLGDFQSKTGRRLIKSITFEVKGDYAYGYLKKEAGVHRLVRISPFSPEKKRHTSFALVEVLPDIAELGRLNSDLEIPQRDLKIEFFRSSGPGGQNVNKVETAVRLVHLPTGLSAVSQVERSQSQNRERAMNLLKAKILKLMEETQVKELDKLKVKVKPEWGSQIRSYVLHPYKLVKDHRTGAETTQADEVLEGNLDIFLEAEIQ